MRVCVQLFLQTNDLACAEPFPNRARLAHDRTRPWPAELSLRDRLPHQPLGLCQKQTAVSRRLPLLELQQPLNGLDVTRMSPCALDNVERYKALSEAELDAMMELICGCEQLPLRRLLAAYRCT